LIDLDGRARPYAAAFDIGAYEWYPATAPGDFNNDGIVDTADYVSWRKTDGGSPGYQEWRENFAESFGGGGANAVPEPSVFIVLMIALTISISLREMNCARGLR
jgi:hypothetical protein